MTAMRLLQAASSQVSRERGSEMSAVRALLYAPIQQPLPSPPPPSEQRATYASPREPANLGIGRTRDRIPVLIVQLQQT